MKIKNLFLLLITLTISSCNGGLNKKWKLVDIDEKFRNGDLVEAKIDIDNYLANKKDNEYAWTLLGHIESDLDHDSLAVKAYEKALKLNSKTVEAITGMGIVSRKSGDYEKASDYYREAIKIDPEYAEAYSSLVVINLKRKKFNEAVDVGLKGYNLDKQNGTIAANLAVSYHYTNDTIQREKYFKIAKKNGYRNLEALRQVFNDELTILD